MRLVNAAIWTAVEPAIGVVSACLPSLRPLVKMIFSGSYKGPRFGSTNKNGQAYSSGTNFSKSKWGRGNNDDGQDLSSFTRLEDQQPINEPEPAWGHNAHVDGPRKGDKISLDDLGAPSSRQIRVKTEVTLISTSRLEYKDQLF